MPETLIETPVAVRRSDLALVRSLGASRQWVTVSYLVVAVLLAVALRFPYLDATFKSSDEAELPVRVLMHAGYLWMIREYYGLLVSLLAKLIAGLVSALHLRVTEFWWRFPFALMGTLQVPLTYAFLRRLGSGTIGAVGGAALVAVLPIHVFWSRHSWATEPLGVFFVTISLWTLLNFLSRPTPKTSLTASIALALYMVSHGHIIPFVPVLVTLFVLFAPSPSRNPWIRFRVCLDLALRNYVWLFPVLALPLCARSLVHALIHKQTHLGFYVVDHAPDFVANLGLLLTLVLVAGLGLGCLAPAIRSKTTLFLALCGGFYVAPLLFGAPPGLTITREYMLMGIYFWLLGAALVADRLARSRREAVVIALYVCVLVTFAGSAFILFGRADLARLTLVDAGRHTIGPDPGTKAAGVLIRTQVAPEARVLALHRSIEPSNLLYYVGRSVSWECRNARRDLKNLWNAVTPAKCVNEDPARPGNDHSYYDLSLPATFEIFARLKDAADVVLCEDAHVSLVEASGVFERKVVLSPAAGERLWIYARPTVTLRALDDDLGRLNDMFDQLFAPRIRLW